MDTVKLAFSTLLTFTSVACFASGPVPGRLNIETQDGSVTNYPWQLRVTNGSLLDNGDGTMSLNAGGGSSFLFGIVASSIALPAITNPGGSSGYNIIYNDSSDGWLHTIPSQNTSTNYSFNATSSPASNIIVGQTLVYTSTNGATTSGGINGGNGNTILNQSYEQQGSTASIDFLTVYDTVTFYGPSVVHTTWTVIGVQSSSFTNVDSLNLQNGTFYLTNSTAVAQAIISTGSTSGLTDSFAVQPATPSNNGFAGSLGYGFSVTQTIIVYQLGRRYNGSTGGNNQNIYVWTSSNVVTPLVSATVLSTTTSDSNNFKWVSIAPLTLTPGNQYYITDDFQASDYYLASWNASSNVAYQLQFLSTASGGVGQFPNNLGLPNTNIWDTPAMLYTYQTGLLNTSLYEYDGLPMSVGQLPGQVSQAQMAGVGVLLNYPFGQTVNSNFIVSAGFACGNPGNSSWAYGPWGIGVTGGTLFKYNGISTVSNGVPTEFATADQTGQSAAISATTLFAASSYGAGMYRVSGYLKVTTPATISSILGGTSGTVLTYTDGTDSVAQSVTMQEANQSGNNLAVSSGNTGNSTTTVTVLGPTLIYVASSGNIQYAVGYSSTGTTAMVYELHLKLEAL